MRTVVAVLLLVMGTGIAGVWTRDIIGSDHVDLSAGFFSARDPDSGSLFWPHWLAEYATAIALVTAAIGLFANTSWATAAGAVASGALTYTSVNSLGWALAEPERRTYAIPMSVGVVVSVVAITYLFTV